MISTIENFQQLLPTSKSKRGLINPLGSLIKLISGNLNHDDAKRYVNLISKLHGKQLHAKHKVTIISTMLEKNVNSTETLQISKQNLDERLKRIEKLVKILQPRKITLFTLLIF